MNRLLSRNLWTALAALSLPVLAPAQEVKVDSDTFGGL